MEEENETKFSIFKIIAFGAVSKNSHILEQDTSHWQSICYQATLRFRISFTEKFSKPGSIRLMKKVMKFLSFAF